MTNDDDHGFNNVVVAVAVDDDDNKIYLKSEWTWMSMNEYTNNK